MSETTPQRENKMGTQSVNSLLISMALPMIASMLVQALYNIVDSIFVSQLSESALTAVGLAFPVQNLMIAVGVGTGVGVNALLSKSLGERNQEQADSAADTLKQECDRVWNAVTYLRNNYQTDVSAEELAKLCGMSVSAFRREFRLRCGVSPVRYKNTLRMTKARELLRGGDCSVSEASRLVGCPDIYYFSRLYKREFGVPPSRDMISI